MAAWSREPPTIIPPMPSHSPSADPPRSASWASHSDEPTQLLRDAFSLRLAMGAKGRVPRVCGPNTLDR